MSTVKSEGIGIPRGPEIYQRSYHFYCQKCGAKIYGTKEQKIGIGGYLVCEGCFKRIPK